MRIRPYLLELQDQPKIALSLKTRMVNTEVINALLYECIITWTLHKEHYAKLSTVHNQVLLRIIGVQCESLDHWMPSYNRSLEIARCKSIETTLHTRNFCVRERSSERAAGRCQCELCSETLDMQCGEDGVGRRKSGPIAYSATSGRLS